MSGFGLLGGKLSHSYSPLIHSYLGDYKYELYEKQPCELEEFLLDTSISGLNVTIPYKKEVLKYCDVLTDVADKTRSINTIVRKADGSLFGDNTDYYGFTYMIKRSGIDLKGRKVLLLGDGGSAATIKMAIQDMKAASLVTISRRSDQNYDNIQNHYDGEIIINSTPVGMYPNNGESVIDIKNFEKCVALYDLIYNPSCTRLMYDALTNNIPAYNGLSMLVAQAKRSAELFTQTTIEDFVIEDIINKVAKKSMNVLLIGMPGSGKSTVGKALAKLTNRCFIDTDDLISKTYNRDPADIILQDGEPTFRDYETKILREATKQSGCVISTGGGVVTRDENKYLLRQNSVVVFLKRDLSLLSIWNRPISQNSDLQQLYNSRVDKYIGWSDYEIECIDMSTTHIKIKEILGL